MLALYLIYKWMLASENTHSYNRGILLSIYALSPLLAVAIQWGRQYVKTVHAATGDVTTSDLIDLLLLNSGHVPGAMQAGESPLWPRLLIAVWLIGIIFFTLHTIIGFIKVSKIVSSGEKHKLNGHYRLVITDRTDLAPFSTRKSIIISRNDYNCARDLIIAHEMGHLMKKHWFDLLLSRIVTIICWFNPAAWLMAEELKTVHEYQADLEVLRGGADARQYQMLLIKKAVGKSFPAIANSLNHSKLKKRITMMLKSKPCKSRKLRALAFVPAAAAALLVTNIPAVAECLTAVRQSDLSTPQATREVSEKAETTAKTVEESAMPATVGVVANVTESDNAARGQNKNSMTVQIKGKENQTSPAIEDFKIIVNGQPYSDDISSIKPESIESMSIDKANNTINIALKNAGDGTASVKVAETMPQYPGGEKALLEWLAQNIEYPDVNLADQPEFVRVIVKFVVDKDGKAIDPEIVKGGPEVYNNEAIKVVNKMPAWEPGRVDGEPVKVTYTLPINFKTKREVTQLK